MNVLRFLPDRGEWSLRPIGFYRKLRTSPLDGQLLGTPAYMSPELARGEAHQADRRTDLYSLGVVLFQLLTGELPFRGNTRMLVHQVIHDEPPSPPKLSSQVPRDLETICLKCLEKEPARRYGSAATLGAELDRFLSNEPIIARPIGPAGKAWRWCRRKPVVAGLTAAVLALLLTVTVVSVTSSWRISRTLEAQEREAYYSSIELANKLIEEGDIARALETLWKCQPQYRHWEWGHLLYLCHQEAATFQAHATNVVLASFSPDSRWVVSQDEAGLAKVWDWEAEQEVFRFGTSSNRAGWVALHPSGGQLTAAMGTNGVWIWPTTNWPAARGSRREEAQTSAEFGVRSPELTQRLHTSAATAQPLTRPSASAIRATADKSTTLSPSDWERAGVRGPSTLTRDSPPLLTLRPQGGEVTALAYSPSGEQLVTGGTNGTVTL